jgi:hypothetical protein
MQLYQGRTMVGTHLLSQLQEFDILQQVVNISGRNDFTIHVTTAKKKICRTHRLKRIHTQLTLSDWTSDALRDALRHDPPRDAFLDSHQHWNLTPP